MTETKRPDPLRREPPIIDVKATDVGAKGPVPAKGTASSAVAAAEAGTSIEPMAATGLDRAGAKPTAAPPAGSPSAASASSTARATAMGPTGPKAPASAAPSASASGGAKSVPGTGSSSSATPSNPTKPAAAPSALSGAERAGTAATTPSSTTGAKPAASPDPAKPSPSAAASPVSAAKAAGPAPAGAKAPDPASLAPARPRRSGPGLGGLVGAGLLGGVVGAFLATGTSRYLAMPAEDGRLAAVERRVAALPAATPAGPDLTGRVAQLGAEVAAARSAAEAASRQIAEAAGRQAPSASPAADLGPIEARLAPLEDAARKLPSLEAAAGRIGPLEEASRRAGEESASAVRDLGTRLDALGTRTAQGIEANAATLRQLGVGLGDVQGGVGALGTRATEGETRLAAVTADLAKLSPAAITAGLRVVVAGRLDDAFRAGSALGPALSSLEKLGAAPDSVAALRLLSDAPPPAAPALAAAFKPLAERITAIPSTPANSLGDRLLRIAEKVVTVRAVGDGSGTDVPGLVARIEAALGRGALAEAARLWDELPAEPKSVSAEWAAQLKARVAAEAAVRRIGADSLAALDAATR